MIPIGQVIVIAGLAFAFGMCVIAICKTRNYDKGYNDGYKKAGCKAWILRHPGYRRNEHAG
jgi:hypothetical protein